MIFDAKPLYDCIAAFDVEKRILEDYVGLGPLLPLKLGIPQFYVNPDYVLRSGLECSAGFTHLVSQEYTTTVTESENIWISHVRRPLFLTCMHTCGCHTKTILVQTILFQGLQAAKRKQGEMEEVDDENDEYDEDAEPQDDEAWGYDAEELPEPAEKRSRS